MPTWDEPKRLRNIKIHGFDFIGCEAVFDEPVVTWEDAREAYSEHRINLLGWLEGIVVHMTERGDEPHIISLRKAEKHEVRRYAKETTGYSR
ncbi:BrnT family toxin [Ramlibacter sp. H39-3-26]|uniref:BrnT family toxin n=1 Tax=Curvibacter soli TaxID=3031331 RepID=UPI0023DBAB83|nr:BrnT family toxin [Ramlibacter sp. H39-3-26]MDF1486480.1 BrnT family toxin [Ramlibacter sp. H39-3-26]